jgi:hypothetical protein
MEIYRRPFACSSSTSIAIKSIFVIGEGIRDATGRLVAGEQEGAENDGLNTASLTARISGFFKLNVIRKPMRPALMMRS